MGMSFIGSYSGIDQNTIDQLMEAERMPLKQLERQQASIGQKKDAWKDINTRLNSLSEKMNALTKASSFNTKIAKSSDDKYITMTAGTSAAEGKYNIKVKNLASNSSLIGKKATFEKTPEGKPATIGETGSFTITNGDKEPTTTTIKVEAGDTLKDIVNNINKMTKDYKLNTDDENVTKGSGTGISATIVDNRIVLTDEKTGDRSITVGNGTGGILDKIGLNEEIDWKDENGYGFKKGEQAEFTLNGITIYRDTNTISDAIDGITINLNQVHTGDQLDIVTVSADTEKTTKLIQDFVDQYNSTMSFIEEKTKAGDPKIPGSKGDLAGENSLVRLQTSLRRAITDQVGGVDKDGINVASKIGITTTDRSGKLTFDSSKFLEALNEDKDGVMNFLNPPTSPEGEEKQIGLIERADDFIQSFISKENGLIKSQNESFDRTLKDITRRIENFEARMVKKEAYYVKTFTALDLAMMKAEDQMGWLIGQVDAMNGGGRR